MRNVRTKEIALAGVFGAIILLLSLVPAPWGSPWGYPRVWGGIEITIVHIPVIIGGIYGGKRVAITLGTLFGLGSLTAAAIYGGLFAPFFLNPLVSVLPRALFGFFVYLIYTHALKHSKNVFASIAITSVLSTFLHSIMVLTMLYLFSYQSQVYADIFGSLSLVGFMIALIGLNSLFEMGFAALVATPIGMRVNDFLENNAE